MRARAEFDLKYDLENGAHPRSQLAQQPAAGHGEVFAQPGVVADVQRCRRSHGPGAGVAHLAGNALGTQGDRGNLRQVLLADVCLVLAILGASVAYVAGARVSRDMPSAQVLRGETFDEQEIFIRPADDRAPMHLVVSGRSLREWQALTRTEGLFFAARERYEAGQPFDWAGLALAEGFADQAHMNRTVKRITGFAPGEFARRFIEDESFWMYRLWV